MRGEGLRIEIRSLEPEDAAEVCRLEEECFADPWSECSLRKMIEKPHTSYLAVCENGRIIGYCGAQTAADEGDILRVAVAEDCRGHGAASALLEHLFERNRQVVSWYLDVRAGNAPALALYRKKGFLPVGTRKDYYRSPREDAVLMQRKSAENPC